MDVIDLDLKVGTRQYGDGASSAKKQSKNAKVAGTTRYTIHCRRYVGKNFFPLQFLSAEHSYKPMLKQRYILCKILWWGGGEYSCWEKFIKKMKVQGEKMNKGKGKKEKIASRTG